eukprot:Clim_evm52s25 gene=Clim_evmTU52s25
MLLDMTVGESLDTGEHSQENSSARHQDMEAGSNMVAALTDDNDTAPEAVDGKEATTEQEQNKPSEENTECENNMCTLCKSNGHTIEDCDMYKTVISWQESQGKKKRSSIEKGSGQGSEGNGSESDDRQGDDDLPQWMLLGGSDHMHPAKNYSGDGDQELPTSMSAESRAAMFAAAAAAQQPDQATGEGGNAPYTDVDFTNIPVGKPGIKPPGPGYLCKICRVPGHWLEDCPFKKGSVRAGPGMQGAAAGMPGMAGVSGMKGRPMGATHPSAAGSWPAASSAAGSRPVAGGAGGKVKMDPAYLQAMAAQFEGMDLSPQQQAAFTAAAAAAAQGQGPAPRSRSREPPVGYICKICQTPGHWIKECPSKNIPLNGDGTMDMAAAAAAGVHPHAHRHQSQRIIRPPGQGYLCKICKIPGHWLADCPQKTNRPVPQYYERPYDTNGAEGADGYPASQGNPAILPAGAGNPAMPGSQQGSQGAGGAGRGEGNASLFMDDMFKSQSRDQQNQIWPNIMGMNFKEKMGMNLVSDWHDYEY